MNELIVFALLPVRLVAMCVERPFYDLTNNVWLIAYFGGLMAIPLATAVVMQRVTASHGPRRFVSRLLLAATGLYALDAFIWVGSMTDEALRLAHWFKGSSLPFYVSSGYCGIPLSIVDVVVPWALIGMIWLSVAVLTERMNSTREPTPA